MLPQIEIALGRCLVYKSNLYSLQFDHAMVLGDSIPVGNLLVKFVDMISLDLTTLERHAMHPVCNLLVRQAIKETNFNCVGRYQGLAKAFTPDKPVLRGFTLRQSPTVPAIHLIDTMLFSAKPETVQMEIDELGTSRFYSQFSK